MNSKTNIEAIEDELNSSLSKGASFESLYKTVVGFATTIVNSMALHEELALRILSNHARRALSCLGDVPSDNHALLDLFEVIYGEAIPLATAIDRDGPPGRDKEILLAVTLSNLLESWACHTCGHGASVEKRTLHLLAVAASSVCDWHAARCQDDAAASDYLLELVERLRLVSRTCPSLRHGSIQATTCDDA
jgi:hypothetical protein